jgi:nucleoid-associated protein YgaU
MRFKWRRRLAVTAFALSLMLPFAGCSSQQQQASDEVAAEGQGGQEEGGQQSETAAAQSQGGENAEGEEATAQAAPNNEAPAEGESSEGGENVVSNDAAAPAEEGVDAEAQALSGEINASAESQASAEQPAAEGEAATADAGGEIAAPAEGEATASAETAVASAEGAPAVPAEVAAPGLPQMNSKLAYVVEAGDTLGKIATKIYGDQKRWRDIANLSNMSNPNHIYPGDVVYYTLEESSRNFASAYESIKRAKEIVREGDTLAAISKRVYGTSKAWRHIWRQNDNIDNPDELTAGMSVYYVEKGAFSVALSKVKSIELAKVQKVDATKGFKAAGSVKKSNTVVKVPVFTGKSV